MEMLMSVQKTVFHRLTPFQIYETFLHLCMRNGLMFSLGYGTFACVGKHFALMKTKVITVRLLKKSKFTIDRGCDK